MDRGAQRATVHGVVQSLARLKQLRTHTQGAVSMLTPILTNVTDLRRGIICLLLN